MGTELNTQLQIIKNNVVVGLPAGNPAVYGLTVYGDISASGTVYGNGGVGSGGGTVTNIGINSVDNSIAVLDSPVTTYGTIALSINSVGLDKLKRGDATTGQVLTYNGTTWVPAAVPTELPQTGTNGQVLTYNGTTWVANNVPKELPQTGTNGQVLTYNGTTWVPAAVPTELPQTGTNGQVLTYNGATWVANNVPKELPTSANAQQVLTYDGSTNTWIASAVPTGGGDGVTLPTGTNGQVLTYDGSTNTWIASTPTGGGDGVTLPTGTNGQVLTYNGTTWIASDAPKELPLAATAQQVLTYNGATNTWIASAAPTGGGGGSSKLIIDNDSITSNTPYTLKLADAGKMLMCGNSIPITLTVPDIPFEIGTEIIIVQNVDTGPVTITGAPGVTIRSQGGKYKTNGLYAGVCLIKTWHGLWFLGGNTNLT